MKFRKTLTALFADVTALAAQAGTDPATLPVEKLTADVAVVGAGGTGMAAAAAAAAGRWDTSP